MHGGYQFNHGDFCKQMVTAFSRLAFSRFSSSSLSRAWRASHSSRISRCGALKRDQVRHVTIQLEFTKMLATILITVTKVGGSVRDVHVHIPMIPLILGLQWQLLHYTSLSSFSLWSFSSFSRCFLNISWASLSHCSHASCSSRLWASRCLSSSCWCFSSSQSFSL